MKQTVYLIFYESRLLSIFPCSSEDLETVWISFLKHYEDPPVGDYEIAKWSDDVPDRGAIDVIAKVHFIRVKEEGDS